VPGIFLHAPGIPVINAFWAEAVFGGLSAGLQAGRGIPDGFSCGGFPWKLSTGNKEKDRADCAGFSMVNIKKLTQKPEKERGDEQ